MPTLDWLGKEAVVKHHEQVPFHLLRPTRTVGAAESGNLLVQGDNLLALKALLPHYGGQVKCIYIDPPYNTGNENWLYNDAVNSPEMRAWLGKTVGREDLSRHDKWLCMMYPRLLLAQQFLTSDGVIFISIDDNELANLRIIMDSLFGEQNLLACFTWQTEGNFDNQAKIKIAHEYILAYANDYQKFPPPPTIDPNISEDSKLYKTDIRNTIVKNGPKNPISDVLLPTGFPADFQEGIIQKRTDSWPHYDENIIIKDFKIIEPVIARSGWSSKKIFESFIKNGFNAVIDTKGQETKFILTRTGAIETIKKRPDSQSHVISVLRNMGSTQQMSAELAAIGINFNYPKPTNLLNYLISLVNGNNFTVLDFFAGSGTTGHAVLQLNQQDGGNRRFILVEMEPHIAQNITATRLQRVIEGYTVTNDKGQQRYEHGLGGGLQCYELGDTLFTPNGRIQENVTFEQLARHVFFSETRQPLPPMTEKSPLLGAVNDKAVYLLYNGILQDTSPQGGNALTQATLQYLPPHNGAKVIYGSSCRLSAAKLQELNISFRQIPYQVTIR